MVILQAYVDDSASEVGSKRLHLAGYVNSAERWIGFSELWGRVLRANPQIDYLHMVEAQNLRGQFRGWSEEDRDKKIMALAAVIRASGPWSVECTVDRTEYARIIAPDAPYPLVDPYFACFWGIITLTGQYHSILGLGDVPPVDFTFDKQQGIEEQAAIWYRWLKEEQHQAVRATLGSTPIFRDDKDVVALQAADMLAWHLRRENERAEAENRPAMELLRVHHAKRHIDLDGMRIIAKGLRRVPGVSLVKSKKDWKSARRWVLMNTDSKLPNVSFGRMYLFVGKIRLRAAWQYIRRIIAKL